MSECYEKGPTCVVTGDPPSTTFDWLAQSSTQQVHWELDQTEWLTILWKRREHKSSLAEHTLLRLSFWLLVSGTLVISRLQLLVLGPANPPTATRGQTFKLMATDNSSTTSVVTTFYQIKKISLAIMHWNSPLLLQGIFQHFDSSHQVLFHVLLAFPLSLQKCHLSLGKHTQ